MTSTPIPTRQQKFLTLALDDAKEVEARQDSAMAKIYGGLCHKTPVLVRTCGLCQALAFIEDKKSKTGARGDAYKLLHKHIAGILGTTSGQLLDTVRIASVADYIRMTRLLLSAWVYYKRFAVSILNVEDASQAEDEKL